MLFVCPGNTYSLTTKKGFSSVIPSGRVFEFKVWTAATRLAATIARHPRWWKRDRASAALSSVESDRFRSALPGGSAADYIHLSKRRRSVVGRGEKLSRRRTLTSRLRIPPPPSSTWTQRRDVCSCLGAARHYLFDFHARPGADRRGATYRARFRSTILIRREEEEEDRAA